MATKSQRKKTKKFDEDESRKVDTHWEKHFSVVEGLPIKQNGKVIAVSRPAFEADQDYEESIDNEEDEQAPIEDVEEDFGFVTEKDFDAVAPAFSKKSDKNRPEPTKPETRPPLSESGLNRMKKVIAEICTAVSTDPESSLSKKKMKKSADGVDDDVSFRLIDLFGYFEHYDSRVVELAMFSCALLFKDILPSYRIRDQEDKSVQLKKETKKLQSYEQSLLFAYSRYLKYLGKCIENGLGNGRNDVTTWNAAASLGLSAIRCLGELIRAVPHFNYRAVILSTLLQRAGQPCLQVSDMCCETLNHVIKRDSDGEISYEIVKLMAKALMYAKYDVPERMIRCLDGVKVRVHADQAKDIRRKEKADKKKRKKQADDVDAGLMEALANNENTAKRYQADVLHEICLIYFRIIKQKVGYRLLPVALEGLGRITHLINMDTVEDLLAMMRTLLTASPAPPLVVQLHCVYCALRTLSGPGQELGVDDELFLQTLRNLLLEFPVDFHRWDIALECVEFCLIKKREIRTHYVKSLVRCLFLCTAHWNVRVSSVSLALLHSVLLKYPTIRSELVALGMAGCVQRAGFSGRGGLEEDKVEDFAMKTLRDASSNTVDRGEDENGDGSWILLLLRHQPDGRCLKTVASLTGKEVIPIPFRASDASIAGNTFKEWQRENATSHLDHALKQLEAHLPRFNQGFNQTSSHNGQHKSSNTKGNENKKSKTNVGQQQALYFDQVQVGNVVISSRTV